MSISYLPYEIVHSVICLQKYMLVNAPRLNCNQTDRYSINFPRGDLDVDLDGLPVRRQSTIQLVTT